MRKLIFLLSLLFMFGGCATTQQSNVYRQKQGFMMLDNTEHPRNKKYHQQKRKKGTLRSRTKAKRYYRKIK